MLFLATVQFVLQLSIRSSPIEPIGLCPIVILPVHGSLDGRTLPLHGILSQLPTPFAPHFPDRTPASGLCLRDTATASLTKVSAEKEPITRLTEKVRLQISRRVSKHAAPRPQIVENSKIYRIIF